MKWMRLVPLMCFSVLITSCFEIEEIVDLQANGSGTYQMVYDLGGMFDDPMMSEMIKGSGEDGKKAPEKQDTTISFTDRQQDLPAEDAEALKKLTMRVQMDEEAKLFKLTMNYPFNDIAELNSMLKAFEALNKKEAENPDPSSMMAGGQQGMFTKGLQFEYVKGNLTRVVQQDSSSVNTESEQYNMMKNFMGDANMKLRYTLPAPIKNSTIPGATVKGNELTLSIGLLDMIEKKINLQGSVTY